MNPPPQNLLPKAHWKYAMIEINAATAFFLYLFATLILLVSLWLKFFLRSHKKEAYFTEANSLYLCEYCHFVYMERTGQPNTRCPQCQSLNKSNDYKKT